MTRASTLRLDYADTHLGQLHYSDAGEGPPILLLHQTPRSLDEFAEVQPLLAADRRVIAMDMYGFGMSAKPKGPQTIEQYAEGALALLDALGITTFDVLGHHTGAYVAAELAAAVPHRARALIQSGAGFASAEYRAGRPHDVDVAPIAVDGSHLEVLWSKRRPVYPVGRPDLLDRFVRDALAPGIDPHEGHFACRRYVQENRIDLVTCPVLVLAQTADPHSYRRTEALARAFVNATEVEVVEIEGGTVAAMEQLPVEVVGAVRSFLSRRFPSSPPNLSDLSNLSNLSTQPSTESR